MKQKHNKHGNKRTLYRGILYHSKLEAAYAELLDELKRKGKFKSWTRQERVDLCVQGVRVAYMLVDFLIIHNNNSREYLEVKGQETDVWKLKYKLLKALYPSVKYTVAKAKHYKMLTEKGYSWKQTFQLPE